MDSKMVDEVGQSTDVHNEEDNVEDAAISMVDILKEQEELEDDANAVLGGSDSKNCTYLMVIFSFCCTTVNLRGLFMCVVKV